MTEENADLIPISCVFSAENMVILILFQCGRVLNNCGTGS